MQPRVPALHWENRGGEVCTEPVPVHKGPAKALGLIQTVPVMSLMYPVHVSLPLSPVHADHVCIRRRGNIAVCGRALPLDARTVLSLGKPRHASPNQCLWYMPMLTSTPLWHEVLYEFLKFGEYLMSTEGIFTTGSILAWVAISTGTRFVTCQYDGISSVGNSTSVRRQRCYLCLLFTHVSEIGACAIGITTFESRIITITNTCTVIRTVTSTALKISPSSYCQS